MRPLPGARTNDYPSGPGPDPDTVLCTRISPDTSGDIYIFSMSGKFDPRPLVATSAYEGGAQMSADGRFLVYASNQSGQYEIQARHLTALAMTTWEPRDVTGSMVIISDQCYIVSMKQIAAAKFKEQCLSILDHVAEEGLVITKHGKPVAKLIPIRAESSGLLGSLKGKIKIKGDVLATGLKWHAQP